MEKILLAALILLFSCTTQPDFKESSLMMQPTDEAGVLAPIDRSKSDAYLQTSAILLDFDGHNVNSPYWNGGVPFTCAPSGLSPAQIDSIRGIIYINLIREVGLNIFVMTSSYGLGKYNLLPDSQKIRIVITTTSAWRPGVSGTAYTNSFGLGIEGFVFSNIVTNVSDISQIILHEFGHTAGLRHQSVWENGVKIDEYRLGVTEGNPIGTSGGWIVGLNSIGDLQDDTLKLQQTIGTR